MFEGGAVCVGGGGCKKNFYFKTISFAGSLKEGLFLCTLKKKVVFFMFFFPLKKTLLFVDLFQRMISDNSATVCTYYL